MRSRIARAALAALCLAAAPWPAWAAGSAAARYQLDGTEVLDLPARFDGKGLPRDYQLFVGLPDGYAASGTRRYPLLLVTDANYAFPLLRSIARRVGDHGRGLEDFILVGLSYAKGDTPQQSRGRDYTPSANGAKNPDGGVRPDYGQSAAYRRFIADEVLPLLARSYRIDMARKTFAGHSYGALLGADILLSEPRLFERYALSSPSLWFDQSLLLKKAQRYAAEQSDLPARVLLTAGQYEARRPGDARYAQDEDIVADMRRFEALLAARRYPNLAIRSEVIAGEDHLSVNPVSLTRALKWAFPASPAKPAR